MSSDSLESVGKYELHEELAVGGMARVFLGRLVGAAGFTKCVAIKRVHAHLVTDEELLAMLLEEARITQHIRHPNVVATLDVEATDRELLLVMEYVHGVSLSDLLKECVKQGRRVPVAVAASIAHGVLLGLEAAHETTDGSGTPLSIVHRDVSPQNIIVGVDGVARLLDFGIAKAAFSLAHTRTGELRGKVPYMAPELLRYEPATRRSDVWAVAVVLWETVCTRRLFRGEGLELWGVILTSDIQKPSAVVGDEARPIDDVVMYGLGRDVAERYATAGEMAEAIRRSMPIASPSEVAAWVGSIANPSLARREQILKDLAARPPSARLSSSSTSMSILPEASARASTVAPPAPRRAWMPWSISAVLGIVILGLVVREVKKAGGGAAGRDQKAVSSAAPSLLSAAPALSATSPAAELSSPTSPTAALPPSAEASPLASAVAVAARPRDGKKRSPPVPRVPASVPSTTPEPPRPASTCNPPYSIDEGGRKIFKVECVKEH